MLKFSSGIRLCNIASIVSDGAALFYDRLGFRLSRRIQFQQLSSQNLNNIIVGGGDRDPNHIVSAFIDGLCASRNIEELRYLYLYMELIMESPIGVSDPGNPLDHWIAFLKEMTGGGLEATIIKKLGSNLYLGKLFEYYADVNAESVSTLYPSIRNKNQFSSGHLPMMYDICLLDEQMYFIILRRCFIRSRLFDYFFLCEKDAFAEVSEACTLIYQVMSSDKKPPYVPFLHKIAEIYMEWRLLQG